MTLLVCSKIADTPIYDCLTRTGQRDAKPVDSKAHHACTNPNCAAMAGVVSFYSGMIPGIF